MKLSRDVVLVLSADEEVGSGHDIEWLLEHHPELREAELALNEGGLTELSEDRRRVRFVNLQAAERVSRNVVLKATGPGRTLLGAARRHPTRWCDWRRRWLASGRSPSPPGSPPSPG